MRLLALLAFIGVIVGIFNIKPNAERLNTQLVPEQVLAAEIIDENHRQLLLTWPVTDVENAASSLRAAFKVSDELEINYENGTFAVPLNSSGTEDVSFTADLENLNRPSALSLLPPLLAIFMAFLTRRTL
ncbi:MAG: hypothetical protein QGF46_06145, partial [Planctomycetota bacterium]|nr:hypothetical protein [Planctomycetota bacterium]